MMNKMRKKVSICIVGRKKCINGNLLKDLYTKSDLDTRYTEIHANYTYYLKGIRLCFIFEL